MSRQERESQRVRQQERECKRNRQREGGDAAGTDKRRKGARGRVGYRLLRYPLINPSPPPPHVLCRPLPRYPRWEHHAGVEGAGVCWREGEGEGRGEGEGEAARGRVGYRPLRYPVINPFPHVLRRPLSRYPRWEHQAGVEGAGVCWREGEQEGRVEGEGEGQVVRVRQQTVMGVMPVMLPGRMGAGRVPRM